jgi:hypothetical protein
VEFAEVVLVADVGFVQQWHDSDPSVPCYSPILRSSGQGAHRFSAFTAARPQF